MLWELRKRLWLAQSGFWLHAAEFCQRRYGKVHLRWLNAELDGR